MTVKQLSASYPVMEARKIGDLIVVVYDYMSFPEGEPARNLFAYSGKTGAEVWRAQDIGFGKIDAYTNIISEAPLVVGNFAGYSCQVDLDTGTVVCKAFTKEGLTIHSSRSAEAAGLIQR